MSKFALELSPEGGCGHLPVAQLPRNTNSKRCSLQVEENSAGEFNDPVNRLLMLCPALVAVMYYLGASTFHTKVPIYILLSFQYAVLSWRFFKVTPRYRNNFPILE
jgi:hypothetical protein